MKHKICKYCEKPFVPGNWKANHCKRPACQAIYVKEQREKRRKPKQRICVMCKGRYVAVTPKKTCGDPICEAAFKEWQRLRQNAKTREWRKKQKKTTKQCKTGGCRNRVAKSGYYCPKCVTRISKIFNDPEVGIDGYKISELTLKVETPFIEYD